VGYIICRISPSLPLNSTPLGSYVIYCVVLNNLNNLDIATVDMRQRAQTRS